MAVSEAQKKASAKWDSENTDKITTKVPKGTKETISLISNDTMNAFAKKAILDRIYRIEHNLPVDQYNKEE